MQPREKLVLEFWDRSGDLSTKNKNYKIFATGLFNVLLKSDVKNKDLTTDSLIKNQDVCAIIIAKENGILAGAEEFKLFSKGFKADFLKNDGDKIKYGDVLAELKGNAKKILERERMLLNLLQRMSGIATLSYELSRQLKTIKLAATRKNLWGCIDKKAVSIGGGLTHRLNMSDGILIKDNHLKILDDGIEKALRLAKNKSKYVEIEVEDRIHALRAAKAIKGINKGLFAIMLDKIPPEEVKSIIQELKDNGLYDGILFEASGNINPDNFIDYAGCGADVISMGYITNSAKALNMSMEIKK